jgi:hypothetical protein
MQLMLRIPLSAIIPVCLMATAAILVNMIYFVMIGKINAMLPENERISYFWWGTQVRKRFKQLCPGNKIVLLLDSCVVLMILCFILTIRFWVFS